MVFRHLHYVANFDSEEINSIGHEELFLIVIASHRKHWVYIK